MGGIHANLIVEAMLYWRVRESHLYASADGIQMVLSALKNSNVKMYEQDYKVSYRFQLKLKLIVMWISMCLSCIDKQGIFQITTKLCMAKCNIVNLQKNGNF